jgi:hypothetical protein
VDLGLGLSPDLPLSQFGFSAYVKLCQFWDALKLETAQATMSDVRLGFNSGRLDRV